MQGILDFLFTRTWWTYDARRDWYAQPYHGLNLIEGTVWLLLALCVVRRHLRFRRSPLERAYGLAFFTFGLSDFREAYVLQSWLILFKGVNLAVLLYLRRIVIRRFYPESKTY